MDSGVMIVLSVICCVFGFFLNRTYAKKYGEAAIQWKLFALQVIGIGGALTQLPADEISFRFLFWITVTFLSYGAGLWLCRQHAKRQQAGWCGGCDSVGCGYDRVWFSLGPLRKHSLIHDQLL